MKTKRKAVRKTTVLGCTESTVSSSSAGVPFTVDVGTAAFHSPADNTAYITTDAHKRSKVSADKIVVQESCYTQMSKHTSVTPCNVSPALVKGKGIGGSDFCRAGNLILPDAIPTVEPTFSQPNLDVTWVLDKGKCKVQPDSSGPLYVPTVGGFFFLKGGFYSMFVERVGDSGSPNTISGSHSMCSPFYDGHQPPEMAHAYAGGVHILDFAEGVAKTVAVEDQLHHFSFNRIVAQTAT